MAKYTIRLDTPKKQGAGTNADVQARVLGSKGKTPWRVLDNPGDDREQGDQDYYRLTFDPTFGDFAGLELRVKKADNDDPKWLLHRAYFCAVSSKELYQLYYNKWINPTSSTSWITVKLNDVLYEGKIQVPNAWGWKSDFLW